MLSVRWRALLRRLERRHVRNNELALILLGGLIGVVVGLGVALVRQLMQWMHQINFDMPADRLLSEGVGLTSWRILLVPAAGGLAVGIATLLIRHWRPREIVDAIEANALYGGKMSLVDSANLTLLTILSGGFGASVGLEAAYTQLGSGFASRIGRTVRLRRNDLRTLVGCGAAAAIAAAFNAPLAGAFYAFELIIGSYSATVLAPVTVAALAGTFAEHWIAGAEPLFLLSQPIAVQGWDYLLCVLVGGGAAFLGIATMLGVTWTERLFRHLTTPTWLRPMLAGLAIGLIAYVWPQVLGSGHGAIQEVIAGEPQPLAFAILFVAKAVASALSVGAGFRGGLFSSSLFLGSLFGSAAGGVLAKLLPGLGIDPLAYTLVGMGSVAAAIVGAPVTMMLLILELTANFYVAIAVMVGVTVASIIVRLGFGYSFATWRFHLRGVPIRSAVDIGWLRDLTVARIMRKDAHIEPEDLALAEFRHRYPLGGPKRVFLTDAEGGYAGIVVTADAHGSDLDEQLEGLKARDIRHGETQFLLPHQSVRAAIDRFVNAELEALPVLSSTDERRILGFVTEAYALRRYNQELERSRGDDVIASTLFGGSREREPAGADDD